MSFTLNGCLVETSVFEDEFLTYTLNRRLGFGSVREACGVGVCGCCSVLLDGRAASACLTLSILCGGRDIVTAESLPDLSPLGARVVASFSEKHAYQCSFCTPGMAVTVYGAIDSRQGEDVDVGAVSRALDGNLCRCGSYVRVMEAIDQIC
jgi:carbon-monoxide dehydrogenase small subunit/xanthine dehydrogenase YagT iron-sulfur-binding subunit